MKPRAAFYTIALAFAVWCIVALGTGTAAEDPPPTTTTTEPTPPDTVQGKTAREWHHVATRYLARVRSLRHSLHQDPETSSAIRLACVLFPAAGCAWLWRVAECESHYYRYARNRSSDASGVFQFLGSTWARTPAGRAGLSVFDPYANAAMAGYVAARGGRRQWVCR